MSKKFFIGILISFFYFSTLQAQSVNLPLDHWAYQFLERMETRGILAKMRNGSRPFTRVKIARWLQKIDTYTKHHPEVLSKVEKDMFERLKGEFWDELKDRGISIKKNEREPHFYSWQNKSGFIHLDVVGGGNITLRNRKAQKEERRIISPYYGGIIRGSLRGVGFYSDSRIFAEWGSRKYAQHYQASKGYPQNVSHDSSMATWDTSDSYFTLNWRGFHFEVGRDNVRWGPSFSGGLMISGLAPSFDLIKITGEVGTATFTWFHGALRSDYPHKWISAHRVEMSLAKGVDLGLGEVVIYGNRGMEMAYVNPLIPYLIAEHTLGDRDNVALGFDFDINRIRNLRLYSEFFIDDLFAPWEVFSKFWGNKLAFTIGGYWVNPLTLRDSGIRWEYTRIEPYVYTHHDSVNVYEHYNSGLGHFLEPNSDGLFLRAEHRFSLALSTTLTFSSIRHGIGNRRTPHREDEGLEKHFLAGVVEHQKHFGAEMEWEIIRDVRFRVKITRVWLKNWKNIYENDRNWNELMLTFRMNW